MDPPGSRWREELASGGGEGAVDESMERFIDELCIFWWPVLRGRYLGVSLKSSASATKAGMPTGSETFQFDKSEKACLLCLDVAIYQ